MSKKIAQPKAGLKPLSPSAAKGVVGGVTISLSNSLSLSLSKNSVKLTYTTTF